MMTNEVEAKVGEWREEILRLGGIAEQCQNSADLWQSQAYMFMGRQQECRQKIADLERNGQ